MKIRNKLLLAITVPVGLLVVQIAAVNVFVRELQEAATFISATHETIEEAFTAADLVSELRQEAKRLPASFVSNRAEGDEGLVTFKETFGDLDRRIRSIGRSEHTRTTAGEILSALDAGLAQVRAELALADRTLAESGPDMDTLLARAVFLDTALVRLASALTDLSRDLRIQLQTAVDREREIHNRPVIAGIAIGGLSVLMLLIFTWLIVDRHFITRVTALSGALLSIARGDLRTTLPAPKGSDEIDEMARTVETFRFTALERDRLLEETGQAAERLEREVADRTAELEGANRYKTRFLAVASHDLRQPLNALNLFIEQLRDKPDPRKRRHLESRISDAATSINELIDSLLDMSKLEAGVLAPEVVSLPVAPVLDRLEATFATAAANKNLDFRTVGCSLWVCSDAILLERILMNLVSNAVRATDQGGIVVGCRRRGDDLRIDVCDTGPGIPEDLQSELFREFFRLDAGPPGGSDSLGLGLSIVDGLAQVLGHRVELESKPGQGTRFSVTVPVARSQPSRQALPEPSFLSEPMQGRRILVIENDALVRESMSGILGSWGCVVTLAEGVTEAAGIASEHAPDLIISDYRLGRGQTGVEAIGTVHRITGPDVPAILITAETGTERLREAADSGFPILHKPVTPMALRALASRMLNGP